MAEALRETAPEIEVVLLGPADGDRLRILRNKGFRVEALNLGAGDDARRSVLELFLAARRGLASIRPSLVLVAGGPGWGGALIAAAMLGMAAAFFVPDAEPGFPLRCLGRLARRVFLAYREAEAAFPGGKAVFTGYPIHTAAASRRDLAAGLGLEQSHPNLLVLSRGRESPAFTQAFLTHLPSLLLLEPRVQILHLVAPERYAAVGEAMAHLNLPAEMAARVHTMPDDGGAGPLYSLADLVLADTGAINPAELAAGGLPMVLVGRDGAPGIQNARAMARVNAALLLERQVFQSGGFLREIGALIKDPIRLERMRLCSKAMGRSDAASTIAGSLLEMGVRVRRRPHL